MSLDRLIDHANALVAALGIVEPRDRGTQITVLDAQKWVVKTLRELRHSIAIGGSADVDGLTKALAEHLADPIIDSSDPKEHEVAVKAWESRVAAASVRIRQTLEAERVDFEDHVIEHGEALGEHAIFHEDHGIIDARKYDDNQMPLSARLNRATFEKGVKP
jgi:hypothetical protein